MIPAIFRLPGEILDDIIAELDIHKDLLAFALASRAAYPFVVPRHTEYRLIRTRHTLPAVWAHLARRADLARNIRELHICDRADHSAPDHFPTTLIKSDRWHPQYDAADESTRVRNICLALSHMSRLRVFNWSWLTAAGDQLPASHFLHENAILAAVAALPSLQHLRLAGRFAVHAQNASVDIQSERYPGWNFSNLTSLSLVGPSWAKLGNSKHILHLINRSPNLEYLEVPLEFRDLSRCHIPSLKKLRLEMQAGLLANTYQSPVQFLSNHPGIEELQWHPFDIVSLPYGCLPNLKTLLTTRQVFEALDHCPVAAKSGDDAMESLPTKPMSLPIGLATPPSTPIAVSYPSPSPPSLSPAIASTSLPGVSPSPLPTPILRPIEHLSITNLDPSLLLSHQSINRTTLKRVEFKWLGQLTELEMVAEAFPNIEWLKIPDIHLERPLSDNETSDPMLAPVLSSPPASPISPTMPQFQLSQPLSMPQTHTLATPNQSELAVSSPHPKPLPLLPLIRTLCRFPRLKTLRTAALWKAIQYDPNKMHEVIRDVVGVCGRIEDLDFHQWYGKMNAFKRILIKRERAEEMGEQEERVSYAVVHPRIADVWDISKGLFR